MPFPIVTVVVPTLAADDALAECLRSLESQTFEQFEVIVVDNSGERRVRADGARVRVIANARNVGFGTAVNQAFRDSQSEYLATLNDDAVADPCWLETLIGAAGKLAWRRDVRVGGADGGGRDARFGGDADRGGRIEQAAGSR